MTAPEGPGAPSAEQRLMELADAARRVRDALDAWAVELIMTDPADRPRDLPDGRLSVTVEAWNAWARNRDAVGRLVELALREG